MTTINTTKLLIIAGLTGFIGDLLVQLWIKQGCTGKSKWGLKKYFRKHGVLESAFIAVGIITMFYSCWILLRLPLTLTWIIPIAIIVDLIWNKFHLFPSLNKYYKQPVIQRTILGVIIPFALPIIIYKLMNTQKL